MARPNIVALVAGLPPGLHDSVVGGLAGSRKNLDVLNPEPLAAPLCSSDYAEGLFRQAVDGLRAHTCANAGQWDVNFVVLFRRAQCGCKLVERLFSMEALLAPLSLGCAAQPSEWVCHARCVLECAEGVLSALREEVSKRAHKTSVLLPPANFGADMDCVKEYVQRAVAEGLTADQFRGGLSRIAHQLPRRGGYFSRRDCVFEPALVRHQHGIAPGWVDRGEHGDRCTIRGHLRFGVPFSPRFHYDYQRAGRKKGLGQRRFPGCHGDVTLPRGRVHANIAPNDHVR